MVIKKGWLISFIFENHLTTPTSVILAVIKHYLDVKMSYNGLKKISYVVGLIGLLVCNVQSVKAFQPDTVFTQRLKIIEKNIPYQLTEQLQDAIYAKMYTDKQESELILTRSISCLPLIEKELWQNDLPSEFKYIPVAMSGLDPTNITYNGGAGIWGLQYIISKKYGLQINEIEDERRDNLKSTCVSIQYIQDLQKMYGSWTLTLLAFITSPSEVNSAICRSGNSSDPWKIYEQMQNKQKGLFIEFVASAYLLNYYDAHGIEKKQPDFDWANCNTYPVEVNTSLADVSLYLGLSETTLKQANPTIRSHYIPGNKGYFIRIPVAYSDKYSGYKPAEILNLAAVQNQSTSNPTVVNSNSQTNVVTDHGSGNVTVPVLKTNTDTKSTGSYQTQKSYYKVKSGDNLGKIAGKYHVSVSSLKSWNGLKNDKIYVGQKICIHKKVWVAAKTTEVKTDVSSNTTNNTDVEKDNDLSIEADKTVIANEKPEQKTTTTEVKPEVVNNTNTTNTTSPKTWVTYKVDKGDTLWKIATKHGVTVDDIRNNNNLAGDKIIVGQVLKIKSK
jgi:membrane-bound lytic murein transglycosylase D